MAGNTTSEASTAQTKSTESTVEFPDDLHFVSTARRLHGEDSVMDVRVAAIEDDAGKAWVIGMTGRIQTRPDEVQAPSCQKGFFMQKPVPLRDLPAFLAEVRSGAVTLNDRCFHLSHEEPVGMHLYIPTPRDLSPDAVSLTGTLQFQSSRALSITDFNGLLLAADPPWDGMDDVGVNFLRLSHSKYDASYKPTVAFSIDYPVAIRGMEAHASRLDIEAVASMPGQLRELDVGVIVRKRGRVIERFKVRPFEAEDKMESQQSVALRSVGHSSYELRVFFHWHDHLIGSQRVSFSSPDEQTVAHRALSAFVDDADPLRVRWEKIKGKPDLFEDWVVQLFSCLGLHTTPTHKGIDGPDLVAYHEGFPDLWLVECTIRNINSDGKLGKLLERSRTLEGKLGRGVAVSPVIATRLPREDVPKHEWEAAGHDDVILLASDDLLELAGTAVSPMDRDAFQEWMLARRIRGSTETMGARRRLGSFAL